MTESLSPVESEEPDYRRWSDNILHWQERPYVYPFSNTDKKNLVKTAPAVCMSTYKSEFVGKPITYRKIRPVSTNRRNKPHPQMAFHFSVTNKRSYPVVRTKMTEADVNKRIIQSPLVSTTHRQFQHVKPKTADRPRIIKTHETAANGVVPELTHGEETSEVKLFPVIPRNARLTADRADKISHAVIKSHGNKFQPHLKALAGDIIYNKEPNKTTAQRPGLRPLQKGLNHSLEVEAWDGSPVRNAATTSRVYGRKKMDITKIPPAAVAVLPELPPPKSKSIMFNDYVHYPKFAPQIFQEFYRKKQRKQRQCVW